MRRFGDTRGARQGATGERGLTVLELLVVVAVIGIVMVAIGTAWTGQIPKLWLEGMANETAGLMQRARLHAIRTNAPVTLSVEKELNGPVTGDNPDGVSREFIVATDSLGVEIGQVEIRKGKVPEANYYLWGHAGVVGGPESNTFPGGQIAFQPDGTVDLAAQGAFRISDRKSPQRNVLEVAIQDVTGQPKIRKFLLAIDSPSGVDDYFEPTVAGQQANVWVWY